MKALDAISDRIRSTNKNIAIAIGIGLVIGLILLWASARDSGSLAFNATFQALGSNLGGLLVATALITVAWELGGKRAFADEILAKTHLSAAVERSGLTDVTSDYLSVPWTDLIDGASKIDIVVAYATTWRNANHGRLSAAAKRSGCRIRVFLPDPDDDLTMQILADRVGKEVTDVEARVREAIDEFAGLNSPGGATLEVYLRAGGLLFSCYRFDNQAVLTLNSHMRDRRSSVPTFTMGSGDLWKLVYDETNSIRKQSKQVFPATGGTDDEPA